MCTILLQFYFYTQSLHLSHTAHNRRIFLNAEPTTATLVVQHFMSSALRRAVSRDSRERLRSQRVQLDTLYGPKFWNEDEFQPKTGPFTPLTQVQGSSLCRYTFIRMHDSIQSKYRASFPSSCTVIVIYIIPGMFHCIQKDQLMWYIRTAESHWTIIMPSTMSHDLMAILQSSRRGKQWVSQTGEQAIKCPDRFQRKQISLTNIG